MINKKDMIKSKKNTSNSYIIGFSRLNYLFFVIGLLMIFLGYIVMATGHVTSFQSLTLAPILLFLGYIVFIPLSLIISIDKD